jgi:hypothetical protein
VTRFQALSTGNAGEEAYRIFYVGAESTGGLTPSFFAGSTTCTNTTPGNCKVLNYPAQQQVTGHVCGNTLVADVPLSGFGNPVSGPALQRDRRLRGPEQRGRSVRRRRRDALVRLRVGSNKGGSSC